MEVKTCLDMHINAGIGKVVDLEFWIKITRGDLLDLESTNGLWEGYTTWRGRIHANPINVGNELR